jgi:GH25 family lysozyme M1 (1,4-beta-N-acetylmuramidase)
VRAIYQAQKPHTRRPDGKPGRKTLKALELDVGRFFSLAGFMARHPGRRWGIDVSFHQKGIRWDEVAAAGVEWSYLRCTQRTFKDSFFHRNVQGCEREGIPWGCYQVTEPWRDGKLVSIEKELITLLRHLGDRRGSLPLAIDIEQSNLKDAVKAGWSKARITDWMLELKAGMELEGIAPILYISAEGQKYIQPVSELVDASWWIVDYIARGDFRTWHDAPTLAPGWEAAPWRWRQVCEEGSVPGIAGAVDLNIAREGWQP